MQYSRYTAVICLLVVLLPACEKKKSVVLKVARVKVDSLSQIVPVKDSLVQPIIYSGLHDLDQKPIPEMKELFISAVLPSILIVKNELAAVQDHLRSLKGRNNWALTDSTYYDSLKEEYKAIDLDDLILRMETLPNSIVLAQAALESGWGQSRFFLEGNNIFGIWSYNKDEPRLRAHLAREERTVHVRHYNDLVESIRDYFQTLGSAPAYKGLRKALQETQDPYKLLPHLKHYSEQRDAYVRLVRLVIDHNDFTRYDHYVIDPQFFIEK